MNKFTVSPKSIIAALTLASKPVVKNAVVPIIEDYLFQVTNDRLVISGTDLQSTMRVYIPISGVTQSVDVFSFVVPPSIIKYLQKVDSEVITFEYIYEKQVGTDRHGKATLDHLCKLLVTDSDGTANYQCEYHQDFPKAPVCNLLELEVNKFMIAEFKDLLTYASSDEMRPAMTGIYFGMHENKATLCATDGHRLKTVDVDWCIGSKEPIQTQEQGQVFILPAKVAKILTGLKIKDNLSVSFKRTEKKDVDGKIVGHQDVENIMFTGTVDGIMFELIARNIDERYPQFWNVIPEGDGSTRLTVNKKSLIKLIDKALLFANRTTHLLRITLNGENKLSAEDLDFSQEFSGKIPDSVYYGEELEIGFNGEFLKECITNVSDTFTIDMWTPNKAGVIRDGRTTVLIMPVKIESHA